ncbi:MAG: chemotaxis protein CheV [Gammaproteobacteria bacterium]|nr:MAG: chemotaxis protein CheV [Gammaproteobacteria bacterium]RKZ96580.1 MAG: chemotaxis protein CheV [Gammaproteobacteria bacterium]
MASMIDGIDQRTQLVGQNRLELLLFSLSNKQSFGINVFKVREVIPCPTLTQIPLSHPVVRGAANIRGITISIFDLSMGIGGPAVEDLSKSFVIITEYNRSVQGFLVSKIDRIINTSWADILPPPSASGADNYMTAITKLDDKLVEIIDVEKVLAEVIGADESVSSELKDKFSTQNSEAHPHILVADDSSVARHQIKKTMDQIGIETTIVRDGKEALDQLKAWAADDIDIKNHISLVISDIEMPEMDGYTLTTEIRKDPQLQDIKVLLHTSMSGAFNNTMVEKVGADRFVAKFSPDDLASAVQDLIEEWKTEHTQ